jgi:hypothetical protein
MEDPVLVQIRHPIEQLPENRLDSGLWNWAAFRMRMIVNDLLRLRLGLPATARINKPETYQ